MRLGILCGGTGWHVQDLLRAATEAGHSAEAVDFRRVIAEVPRSHSPFEAIIVRTMPAGSLEQIIFRMDCLHAAVAAATEAPVVPLPVLLAKADVKKGESIAAACKACHSFEKTAKPGANPGPPLYGVVERAVASMDGYAYSDVLKAKGGKWNFAALDSWITNAKAYVPNTKMVYLQPDAEKRANIIAYLNTLSDSPAPLPK